MDKLKYWNIYVPILLQMPMIYFNNLQIISANIRIVFSVEHNYSSASYSSTIMKHQ